MNRLLFAISLTAGVVTFSGGPARMNAANINDLNGPYSGFLHHNNTASQENVDVNFTIDSKGSGGKFEGTFSTVPVKGVVGPKGKMFFSGTLNAGGFVVRIKKGKAQLSATGKFIVGSFVGESTLLPSTSGPYTFTVSRATPG